MGDTSRLHFAIEGGREYMAKKEYYQAACCFLAAQLICDHGDPWGYSELPDEPYIQYKKCFKKLLLEERIILKTIERADSYEALALFNQLKPKHTVTADKREAALKEEKKNKMKKNSLSKTTFIRGCQCQKSLWLYKYKYSLRKVTPETQAKFDIGHVIGDLAQKLFPDGANAQQDKAWQLSKGAAITQDFIESGKDVIYEAAFGYSNMYIALDILVKKEGKWYAYEVKSSQQISDTYILDAAFQYYVIKGSKQPIQDIFIVYLNGEYLNELGITAQEVTLNNCDINKLFITQSILDEVMQLQEFVKEKINELKNVVALRYEPNIITGEHCSHPYRCDFWDYCHQQGTQYNIW